MYSSKTNVNILTSQLVAYGVKHVVVCPGSRNAPLVHNFAEHPQLLCHPVTDERSAGFYAIGLCLSNPIYPKSPVAICVTSGSALMNLSPAIVEAYYRHLPIIVISADRPAQWIGQGDGQTMVQHGALQNFVAKTVTLPEGVQKIGKRVFLNCKKLTLVELPESLTQIGDSAFANCRSLGSIIFPDGITYVCRKTFSGCWNLEQVMLPEGLTGIGKEAFKYCYSLEEITLPDHMTLLGEKAFKNCSALEKINLPEGMTVIKEGTFLGCWKLTEISLPKHIEHIGPKAFRDCIALRKVTLPAGLTTIGEKAFCHCYHLAEITLPGAVMSIGEKAFHGCKWFEDFTAIVTRSSYAENYCKENGMKYTFLDRNDQEVGKDGN